MFSSYALAVDGVANENMSDLAKKEMFPEYKDVSQDNFETSPEYEETKQELDLIVDSLEEIYQGEDVSIVVTKVIGACGENNDAACDDDKSLTAGRDDKQSEEGRADEDDIQISILKNDKKDSRQIEQAALYKAVDGVKIKIKGRFYVYTSCGVSKANPKAQCPRYVFGTASGTNPSKLCKLAQKRAKKKLPKGCKAQCNGFCHTHYIP